MFEGKNSPLSPRCRVRDCIQVREKGIAPEGCMGGDFQVITVHCQTRIVVLMGTVSPGCALHPLKTRLERAAYEPRIAASRVTVGFCLG